ncbi:MAG TPA: bifunctional riboflavin kinase/FAD synthetase, partial [Planctomycetales bacterium]|nr:bifunctional riboflavin kinase/FAD synthetase [Planctomycetales bacterium]
SFTVDWRDAAPGVCRDGTVAVGNFDGVHLGHASLIAAARAQATEFVGPAVAVTFDPHPRDVLRPDLAGPLLTTTADRVRLLQEAGADHVLVLRTTHELLHLTASEFFNQVLRDRLAVRRLVEGVNFGFGRGREGNLDTLSDLCRPAHISLTIVPPVVIDGAEASSSRVRSSLLRGDVEEAAKVLGRPYRLHGITAVGQRRGRTLGFPTANLDPLQNLAPGDGVYAVRVYVGEEMWPGAANIGPNPTFGENARKVEVHLIGFQGDLYGQSLAVDFIRRLRDTRSFKGADDLVRQLRQDIAQARQAVIV